MGEALELTAGAPLEAQRYPVGRRSTLVIDPQRSGRMLGVEMWYPAAAAGEALTTYELFPGASFQSAGAQHEVVARSGQYPLIVFSHGRTGMRFAYAMICEAFAARGAVVVSSDHPGDSLFDWLLGTNTDDRTNEINRVADAHLILDTFLALPGDLVPVDVANAIDHTKVALAGHSYGAFTAFDHHIATPALTALSIGALLAAVVVAWAGWHGHHRALLVVLGVMLLDLPGKRRLERRIARIGAVRRTIARVRKRFARPPLLLEEPAAPAAPVAR